MNIGEAAAESGLTSKTIRYYEDIGLIDAPRRTEGGYRDYDRRDVHVLRFLRRARSLGFTVEECRDLLALYADRDRASADVKAIVRKRVDVIDRKFLELQSLRAALADLAERCHGDSRPDCPILDDLAGSPS
jgi:MerR family copper efflux transcriptional regulator